MFPNAWFLLYYLANLWKLLQIALLIWVVYCVSYILLVYLSV